MHLTQTIKEEKQDAKCDQPTKCAKKLKKPAVTETTIIAIITFNYMQNKIIMWSHCSIK